MIMVVVIIIVMSLFAGNQVLVYATREVQNYETGMKEN
jgi:hypothetical protein